MMVALMLYAYCMGVRSSRAIEKACSSDVPLRARSHHDRSFSPGRR